MKRSIIVALLAASAGVAMAAPEKPKEPRDKRDRQEQPRKQDKPKTLDRAEPDKRQGDSFLWDGAREGAALDRGRPSNPGFNNWDMWGKK